MKFPFFLLFFLLICQYIHAQETYTSHTLTTGKNFKPSPGKVEQLSWMAGNWQGTEDDVISEEQWAKPIAGIMMGMYRMIVKGKPLFYELMILRQDSNGVTLQLKHFWHPLKGWEDKDSAGVIFALLKTEGKKAFFDGMTYELINENELVVYLAETTKEGGVKEEIFRMKRNTKN